MNIYSVAKVIAALVFTPIFILFKADSLILQWEPIVWILMVVSPYLYVSVLSYIGHISDGEFGVKYEDWFITILVALVLLSIVSILSTELFGLFFTGTASIFLIYLVLLRPERT